MNERCKTFIWDDVHRISSKKQYNYNNITNNNNKTIYISSELISLNPGKVHITIFPTITFYMQIIRQFCTYIQNENKYELLFKNYDKLLKEICNISRKYNDKIICNLIPKFIYKIITKNELNYYKNNNKTDDEIMMESVIETENLFSNINKLPLKLRNNLYLFQKKGINFGIKNQGKILIGDEMGLGKTIQAISLAYFYKNDWPLLIITPSSLRLTWKYELLKWLNGNINENDIKIIQNTKDKIIDFKQNISTANIIIISYNLLIRKSEEIFNISKLFGMIICDESHKLKNYNTKRCKIILPLIKNIKRAILLSGTPTNNRPSELWTQINALLPNYFGNWKEYTKRYCEGKESKYGWEANGSINLKELHCIIKNTIVIRRMKKDVMNQLPNKIRNIIKIEIENKHLITIKKKMKQYDKEINSIDMNYDENDNQQNIKDNQNKTMLYLYALTSDAKLNGVCEYLFDVVCPIYLYNM